ncbi:MAG: spore germination protein [Thermacetogeniaceae bacterium]
MSGFFDTLKGWLLFAEPAPREQFILRENESEGDGSLKNSQPEGTTSSKKRRRQKGNGNDAGATQPISRRLADNLSAIKERFNVPTNSDVMIREFDIIVGKKAIAAFMIYYDGMVDRKVVNDDLLLPLMLLSNLDIKSDEARVPAYIRSHLLTHNQIKVVSALDQVVGEINFGGVGIFVDGMDSAFTADVKGFEHRTVERPNTEMVIRGPQEGFTETIRVNTALIRKRLKDEDLIVEDVLVGLRSKTPCAIMYIRDIANDSIVAEVRRRLKSIQSDYIHDSGEIEQFIEESTFLTSPHMVATERPDRVAALLTEGRVAVIVHGSPFALVMPTTAFELVHSPEDHYVRVPYANLLRAVRILAMTVALLLPGLYIAITNFHQGMLPTGLLLSIEAARERVPFPSLVEILIMEVSFELIREAGIRIPGTIGPTLGIIGALILGQAAVAASIVSPILIIVVAITGIGSFAIPNFSYAYSFRILRFGYIILGALAGFLGISLGLFLHGMTLVTSKSFGVPFMAPFAPRTAGDLGDVVFKEPIWKQERRPDYLEPKDEVRQPKISRGWIGQQDRGGDQHGE